MLLKVIREAHCFVVAVRETRIKAEAVHGSRSTRESWPIKTEAESLRGAFSDGRRRSYEEGGLCGAALYLRLMLNCDRRDHRQDWQGMNCNCGGITVCRYAESASTGVSGGGGMGMSGFQAVKNEDEQYAAQRDPAP
ncbi:MAG: hypothetical protein JWQ87_4175 [Candidatus Sulfotelmatobacter sp.]|nr:hypothetical protein [Candidatus Sulfotelmatobacter sp.]